MRLNLALLALVTLVGCASLDSAKTGVFVEPVTVAPGLDASLGPKARVALDRVVAGSGRYTPAPADKALFRGLTEVVADPAGPFVSVSLRIVDANGALVDGFSATVLAGAASWAWTFQNRWASASSPQGPLDLVALISGPPGTKRDEALLEVRFLDRLRRASAWSDAALSPAVAAAYRARFGREMASALEGPSLVFVEGGKGYLGSDQGEADEAPLHSVTVSGFLMDRTEVTQALYAAVTGTNPSLFTATPDAPRRPVERVTWYDAVEFCNLLSARDGLEPVYTITSRNPAKGTPLKSAEVTQDRTKNGYRLPTEAEWEWAARGGLFSRQSVLSGGDDPALVAWTGESDAGPGPVAEKAANELGLYDLSGNVWEWCWDWYARYQGYGDPEEAASGVMKVGRGGSWHAAPWMARVSARSFDTPGSRSGNLGFRVVRSLSLP